MIPILLVNGLLITLVIIIHDEFLFRLTRLMPYLNIRRRSRLMLGVFGGLAAHAVEVWVFAFAYYIMHAEKNWGHLEGNYDGTLLGSFYYSLTTFTTLGFGDIVPHGDMRYTTGMESLTGLVLITWTASFLFIEMQKYWAIDEVNRDEVKQIDAKNSDSEKD